MTICLLNAHCSTLKMNCIHAMFGKRFRAIYYFTKIHTYIRSSHTLNVHVIIESHSNIEIINSNFEDITIQMYDILHQRTTYMAIALFEWDICDVIS